MYLSKIAFFAALGWAAPSLAQTESPGQGSEPTIIVEGERLTHAEVRKRAHSFVRTLGITTGERGAARWVAPICLRVRGVPDDIAAMVETHIRTVAMAAEAPLSTRDDCKTNLLVAFVEDGREMAQFVSSRRPNTMYQVEGPARRDLTKGDQPIRWWYTIGAPPTSGSSGDALSAATGGGEGGISALPGGVPVFRSYSTSPFIPPARAIVAATVMIDVNRAEGISLASAAAYAAFVGLSEVRNVTEPPVASILNLFQPGGAEGLTYYDSQFLSELYDMPLQRKGRTHRGYLVRAMAQEEPEDRR